jgi:hypothetical protein
MTRPPVDLRKHAAQTRRRMIFAGLGLTFVLGTVLIALTYGTPAAGCGMAFFLAAMLPIGLIALVLALLQWIADRSGKNDS